MQDFHLTLKTRLIYKYVLSFTILFLVGCNSYPDSPEEVVEQYIEYSSNGECEKALGLCYGEAKETLVNQIESGCESKITNIDSVNCVVQDTVCDCISYAHDYAYGNSLILINGEWKLNYYFKVANVDFITSIDSITNSEEVNSMIYFNATTDTVLIEYSGQCIYEYPILQNNDSIYVYFDTIEDCVYRSGVKEFYNLPQGEFPRIGDLFLVMKIDSIRSYNRFLFPRWVDSVNSIRGKQNIFTSEFIVPRY